MGEEVIMDIEEFKAKMRLESLEEQMTDDIINPSNNQQKRKTMAIGNKPSKEHKEFLQEVLKQNGIDLQFEISLCLTDLPKDHLQKAKNGKIYIDLVASPRKEPDQWGRDVKVAVVQTKKDREEKLPKCYVGGGRMITFAIGQTEQPSEKDLEENLPFPI